MDLKFSYLVFATLAIVLLYGACSPSSLTPTRAPSSPTQAPTVAVGASASPTATAIVKLAATPSLDAVVEPTKTNLPASTATSLAAAITIPGEQSSLYIRVDDRWSVERPSELTTVIELDDGRVLFQGEDAQTFAVVDSYVTATDATMNGAEGLRDRAEETLRRVLARQGQDTDPQFSSVPDDQRYPWDFAITYTASTGARGGAAYFQSRFAEGDLRVFGIAYGYRGDSEPVALERMRASLDAIGTLELQTTDTGTSRWAIFSTGLRRFSSGPPKNHYLALADKTGGTWNGLARIELECPDYVSDRAVTQVQVEPSHLWLEVWGGTGAHGGCYVLLSFDGKTLRTDVSTSHGSPNVAELRDLNGDGTPEVVVNQTDDYVFCYACGVKLINFGVLRWDGLNWSPVSLSPLPDAAPVEARRLTTRALDLVHAGLWKDAEETIGQAATLDKQDETLKLNAAIIRLHAEARSTHVRDSGYPLLSEVFYGDYAAALENFRGYEPSQIFDLNTPLVIGTPAEVSTGQNLSKWIEDATTEALKVEPNLASAYFLRGWAKFLAERDRADVLADVERAAQLDPGETLYAQAVATLR